ncbi:Com family DNA-binding transcriptional regulator [Pseudomonas sp. BW13M1]|uniref:Com family DNA-binding transcriptional regulator n=1 Tax=Pseudomonas peradeniyensis TaxID=2745488 RepID=A0A923GBC9_9PSED|nr:Com family DNA-binding transcriptional regulator [Pseudomonas peradeniyensis]MBV4505015.1 Com family DNA-binding transcriptional regulator [Pseudomonas peradeniyensis]
MFNDFRCGKCNRLLARIGGSALVQIKCSRCATLNHMKATGLDNVPTSDQDGPQGPAPVQSIR